MADTLSPQPMPSGSGQKRSHESDDGCAAPKLCKVIEQPDRSTDPGSETEYSFQEESTDLCCRSSTCSSDRSEINAVGRVEYEVRSPEEGPKIWGESSTASDASSVNELRRLPLPKISGPQDGQPEVPDAGNSASSESSDGLFDPEIPRRDYWTCLQCRNVNNRPAFRYCEKCYKVRRDMYQPRLKPRKRRKRKSSKGTVAAAVKENSERTPAFTGVKLSCSQTRDSGVGFSQGTLASGPPASDSTLSDSGADTRDFTGVKLASTRTQGGVLDALQAPISRGVDEVDGVEPPGSRGTDEVDGVWPAACQAVDEVDCPRNLASVEVDSTRHTLSQRSVDEVDCVDFASSKESNVLSSPVSLGVNKRSVRTQTDLSYISKSDVPKEPVVNVETCMMCYSRELDGIFVHSTHAHLVCCYKCATRIWKTTKHCPLCNCKIMNVLRLFKGC